MRHESEKAAPTGPVPRESLATLQAGRGAAALLVVLYHLSTNIFPSAKYWGLDPVHNAFAFGYSGVHFFFVLSGFIIYYIHRKDFGIKSRLRRYVLKRFVRIYPIYWVVLFALIPVYFLVPSFGTGLARSPIALISSITLVHVDALLSRTWMVCHDEGATTVLAVAWTLYHEILFYAFFALAIWNRKAGLAVTAAWFTVSALSMLSANRLCSITFFFTPLHLLFAMGIGASWAVQHDAVRFPRLCAFGGLGCFLATGLLEDSGVHRIGADANSMLYGLSSMLAIIGFVTLERQRRLRIPAFARLLGDASYSIYLAHFPLLSVLAKAFLMVGARRWLDPFISFALIFAIVIGLGVALHVLLEKPLLKRCNNRLLRVVS